MTPYSSSHSLSFYGRDRVPSFPHSLPPVPPLIDTYYIIYTCTNRPKNATDRMDYKEATRGFCYIDTSPRSVFTYCFHIDSLGLQKKKN